MKFDMKYLNFSSSKIPMKAIGRCNIAVSCHYSDLMSVWLSDSRQ